MIEKAMIVEMQRVAAPRKRGSVLECGGKRKRDAAFVSRTNEHPPTNILHWHRITRRWSAYSSAFAFRPFFGTSGNGMPFCRASHSA